MRKLDTIGLTELGSAEMAEICGGFDGPLIPGDTGGADAVIRWFADKLSLPEVQTPVDYGTPAY